MQPVLAAIQMNSNMDLQANLRQAEQLLTEAANAGACLAILPEMFPLLGKGPEFLRIKSSLQEEPGQGLIQDFLAAQAQKNNLWIVGGTIPLKSDDPHKSFASCLVYNERGQVVGRYDKIHLFDVELSESEHYKESDCTRAGQQLCVIDSPVGRLGLAVCFDLRFPEMFRAMFHQGAEVFAVPSAFTVPTGKAHWEILTRAIAVQNFAYVAGAAQYGKHGQDRETHGDSIILSPQGSVLNRLVKGTGFITASIDLKLVQEQRKRIPTFPQAS